MKKIIACLIVIFTCSLCASLASAHMPSATADGLWKKISKESSYKNWSFWPDHKGMQPGRAPHGPFHKVYVNDQALTSEHVPGHYGAIVVKENYGKDKKLKAITVMYKVQDANPVAGDWLWAKYSPSGKAAKFGKVRGCINCHSARADNDYIFVHELQ
ncbi:cytochrome P460 family protein [Desulfotalea psychrophila]|uniref:Cytochrome P460 domain-containing protein n=1 Tax=Desulfotalea psychrophila (strain LSv54 / DSM 12343) TaxID=177439 RepID=Q6ARU6_DESPS|nr:cytochrome P460 family protein [Desulfotalea psychrophila]CAG34929.1 unknown protein [Desulfotalea psychrophila LSv54]